MIKSNSAKIYEAYLADWNVKHPSVVQPEFVSMFTPECKVLCGAMKGSVDTKKQGKCLRPSNIIELVDGRAVECGFDGRGNNLYAVFPSLEAAEAYDAPMGYKVYFERW